MSIARNEKVALLTDKWSVWLKNDLSFVDFQSANFLELDNVLKFL